MSRLVALNRYRGTAVQQNQEDGIYVPDGIIPMHQGGGLIQEGADNIDINTETVDGKNTFHSMARAVFQSVTMQ
jgi:hypothetical protein